MLDGFLWKSASARSYGATSACEPAVCFGSWIGATGPSFSFITIADVNTGSFAPPGLDDAHQRGLVVSELVEIHDHEAEMRVREERAGV